MAKIKYGGGVAEIRGQLVGNIFSRNTAGAYVRGYSTPIQPETPAQLANRLRFADTSGAWGGLDAAQKTAWNKLQLPKQDNIGNSYIVSGYQAFLAINKNRQLVGAAMKITPPADTACDLELMTLEIDTSTELVGPPARKKIMINFTNSPLLTGYRLIVSATAKTTLGRTTQKGRERIIAIGADAQVTAWDVTSAYESYFGQMSADDVATVKIFFQVRAMKEENGVIKNLGRIGVVYGAVGEII